MKHRSFTSSSSGHSDLRRFTVKVVLLGFITLVAQMLIYPYQQKLETARKIEAEDSRRSLKKLRTENRTALEQMIGGIDFKLTSLSMEDVDTKNERQLDFLLIGDSTNEHIATLDDGHIVETTWQLLGQKLPGCNILSISSEALNFVMYDLIAQYLHEKTDYINTIILPVNVRSFGAVWFYSDSFQFEHMRTTLIMGRMNLGAFERPAQLVRIFQSGKISPEYLSQKRQEESDELNRREQIEYGVEDISSMRLNRRRIVYNFEIDPAHPLLRALDSLVRNCQDTNTRLILYATPINIEWIGDQLGDFTARTTRRNLQFLDNYCEESGVELWDFTDALPADAILVVGATADHLRGVGRANLAQLIADELHSKGIANCANDSPVNH